jgi:hypothetical protein
METLAFISSSELSTLLLVFVVVFIIPIIALVDILKNEFTGNNKIIWVLVILLSWIIGAILYFFIGRNQKIKE